MQISNRRSYPWLPALVAVITVGSLALAGLALHAVETELVSGAGETLAHSAVEISRHLDSMLDERHGDAQVLVRAPALLGTDRTAMTKLLEAFQEAYPVYRWLGVLDKEGRVVAATIPATVGHDLSARPGFQAARVGREIHAQDATRFEELDGEMGVIFTGRLAGPGGEFRGAVMTMVGVQVLDDVMAHTANALQAQWGTSIRIEYQLVNAQGDLLIDSLLREEGQVNLKEAGVRSALLFSSAPPSYVEERHLRRGVEVVTGYATTKGTQEFEGFGWGVLIRVDRDNILTPIRKTILKLALLGGVVLLPLLCALVWSTVRLRDERDRAVAERARAESAEVTARELFESANDAIVLADQQGTILSWNRMGEKMFGYRAEEVKGKPLTILMPERFREAHTRGLERYWSTGEARVIGSTVERVGLRRDGSEFAIELSLAAWTSQGQGFNCGILRDITERKRAEAALAESAERLAAQNQELTHARDAALEAARLKSEFLANMSHELRTPMNGVIGMTYLLMETELTAEQREYVDLVRRSGEDLLRIINDILDFSKIEAGQWTLDSISFDPRTLVEGTVELFAERAQHKGLELGCLIHAGLPDHVTGDPGRLRQILTNLIGNAIKFTERGEVIVEVRDASTGRCPRLEDGGRSLRPQVSNLTPSDTQHSALSTQSSGGVLLHVAVRDTGIGIAPEALSRLFQLFTQADGSTTRRFGGTGLGLAICRKLVELMGGEIGIESRPGEGSTFWFTVRLGCDQACQAADSNVPVTLQGLRVLIVDDNDMARSILEYSCRNWGMECVSVGTGTLALERLRERLAQGTAFDLVLLDKVLPDMDGLEVARAMKASAGPDAVRIVLLTGFAGRGDAAAAMGAGIDGYLAKPVKPAQLRDTCGLVMRRSPTPSSRAPVRAEVASHMALVTAHRVNEFRARTRPRVLLAEDNLVNQLVARRFLERLGCRVDVVGSGRKAVDAISRGGYALVLMDCQMPEMDGFEATRQIRDREASCVKREASESDTRYASRTTSDAAGGIRRLPIIAVTANAMAGDREKCLAAGMDDYLSKPLSFEALQTVVQRWLPPGMLADRPSDTGSSLRAAV